MGVGDYKANVKRELKRTIICNIKVLIYVDGVEKTEMLMPGSDNYGVFRKSVIMRLRAINGEQVAFAFDEHTTVDDLMRSINPLYDEGVFELGTERWCIRKGDTRYFFADPDKSIGFLFERYCSFPYNEEVNLEFVLSGDAGDRCVEDGLIYVFHSRESGKHNRPHVHVMDKSHNFNASIDLLNGEVIEPKKLKESNQKKAKKRRSTFKNTEMK